MAQNSARIYTVPAVSLVVRCVPQAHALLPPLPERAAGGIGMRPIVAVRPDVAVLLEPYLEELSADIVQEVVRRIPEYAGESETEHLVRIVSLALQQFADVMTDPEAPWDKIVTLWQEIGEFESAAGRTLELLESTQRSVAQLAWRRIIDKSETH